MLGIKNRYWLPRKRNAECSALPQLALHRDASAMKANKIFHNGETKPQTPVFTINLPMDLEKRLEQIAEDVCWNTRACIRDHQHDSREAIPAKFNRHGSLFRSKFQGVVNKIRHDLLQAIMVSHNGEGIVRTSQLQILALRSGLR